MIYQGPALIAQIKRELASVLDRTPGTTLATLTGRKAKAWAARQL